MRRTKHASTWYGAVALGLALLAATPPVASQESRVRITGEVVDTWCNISGLMFALGTAHHQCAIWCALGGIPVSIRDKDGKFYLLLRIAHDDQNAGNPRWAKLATHEVMVEGDLIARDGVNYLLVSEIHDDNGIVNMTHAEHGIQPFGN